MSSSILPVRYRSAAVLAASAAIYAVIEGPGHATFFLTPVFFGVAACVAGVAGTMRSLIGSGLSLIGWGVAVLLIHDHVIGASRTAPAYMLGIAAGVLAVRLVAPASGRVEWMTAAALSAAFGSAGYFVAFEASWAGRWPAWAITVAVWAAYTAVQDRVDRRPRQQATAEPHPL